MSSLNNTWSTYCRHYHKIQDFWWILYCQENSTKFISDLYQLLCPTAGRLLSWTDFLLNSFILRRLKEYLTFRPLVSSIPLIKTFQYSLPKLQDAFAAKTGRPLTAGHKVKTLLTRQNRSSIWGSAAKTSYLEILWQAGKTSTLRWPPNQLNSFLCCSVNFWKFK